MFPYQIGFWMEEGVTDIEYVPLNPFWVPQLQELQVPLVLPTTLRHV